MTRASPNRKQRRAEAVVAAASKPDAQKPSPSPNGQGPGVPNPPQYGEAFMNQVKRWVDGEEATPNAFVEYLVGRCRQVRGEHDFLSRDIARVQAQLEDMQQQRLRMQGRMNGTIDDIYWAKDNKSAPTAAPEAPKGADAAPANA